MLRHAVPGKHLPSNREKTTTRLFRSLPLILIFAAYLPNKNKKKNGGGPLTVISGKEGGKDGKEEFFSSRLGWDVGRKDRGGGGEGFLLGKNATHSPLYALQSSQSSVK